MDGWRIRGGIDFDFDPSTTIGAGETLVVLKFDPSDTENVNQLAAFRAHYGIDDQVTLLGGYRGLLDNRGDRIQLQRPEAIGGSTVRLWEDEVLYDDLAPWPTTDSETSLQRNAIGAPGNLASSWVAAPATPGQPVTPLPADLNADGRADAQDIDFLTAEIMAGNSPPELDLNGDGMVDGQDREILIFDLLGSTFGDANLNGVFNSRDLVLLFQAGGYQDGIPGNAGWASGDWDGDGDFSSEDLLLAARRGNYTADRDPVAARDARTFEGLANDSVPLDQLAAAVLDYEDLTNELSDALLHDRLEARKSAS